MPDLRDQPLRIAVGWDTASTDAIELAGWLSKTVPSRVRVISAETRPWSTSISLSGKKYKRWRDKLQSSRDAEVKRALKAFVPKERWDKHFHVLADGPSRDALLSEEARRFKADVLLLGSTSKATKGRFSPTRAVDTLMRTTPVTLGLAPRSAKLSKRGLTRITYAFLDTDDSNLNQGLQIASTLALRLDVPLRIVAFSPASSHHSRTTLIDEWNEASLALLDRARDCITAIASDLGLTKTKHFEVQTRVRTGDGWAHTVDSIKWKKGDVVCIGSCVDERAEEFLRHVPVPILVFPQEGS
ncbi:universal stress protein [Corynebacterium aquatimens]|uniref:Nucleotide-binding universal stress UspA family protein n=1 Tax=Corynebacterium aquatimens TaxID=1190508 RepID=A0A931DZ56_9CORY|nr:universal stress protein [Corynebacterium aquatimens]MBG6122780.1 nucleotide-binding universal stress UspA family protein [Corynebacterium aquatimens]